MLQLTSVTTQLKKQRNNKKSLATFAFTKRNVNKHFPGSVIDFQETSWKAGLTVVAAVSGQPLPFGTVGGSDDADELAVLDGQVVLTALCGHGDRRLIHGLLLSCDLVSNKQTNKNTHPDLTAKNKYYLHFAQSFLLSLTHTHTLNVGPTVGHLMELNHR